MPSADQSDTNGTCSVLLADDDRGFCISLRDVLEAAQHQVQVVHSGRETLEACAGPSPFDVLLLDVNLPDLSGVEVIPRVEEMVPDLEILVITGHASMATAVQAVSRSTIGYLVKPLDLEQLLTVHAKIAERKRIRLENLRITAEREALIRELEEKNAELERYAYTVSHDLKSPLVTIKGFLGWLEKSLEKGDQEKARAEIAHIVRASDHMSRLLDGLLALSRIGPLVLSPEPVSISELFEQALQVHAHQQEDTVEIHIADDLPVVPGDRLRLLSLVQNLVDNAVKFGGTRIEVGRRQIGDENACYVRDNGQGVDPAYHEKIFGLFEQLELEDDGGTGIGLALAKRIAEAHGGRIWVESPGIGQGSTFLFVLPDTG